MERRTPYNYSYKGLLITFHRYEMFNFLRFLKKNFYIPKIKPKFVYSFLNRPTFLTPFKKKK